jgi:peptidoglycan/xylan/chitin deacetylase (PgdA/CDA1 family)
MRRAGKEALIRAGRFASTRGRDSRRRRVVVLCYHSVHPTEEFATVSPGLFEEHLSWLSDTCEMVSFRSVLEAARAPESPKPIVSITFDDGYADNHRFALPLLEKYRVPATVFVTTGLIDGDPAVRERFRQLRGTPVEPLAWGQVRELVATGVEIGAHTYSHPNLIRLSRADADVELKRSKAVIEERLQAPVDLFAYPFGKPKRHFDRQTIDLVREAGYRFGAAVVYRSVRPSDSPLAIPRFFTARDSPTDLADKVGGRWDHLGSLQERLPRSIAKIVSPQDFRW